MQSMLGTTHSLLSCVNKNYERTVLLTHNYYIYIYIMHLADAFIQSDLHCIQVTVFTFLSALAFLGNRTHDLGVASAKIMNVQYS